VLFLFLIKNSGGQGFTDYIPSAYMTPESCNFIGIIIVFEVIFCKAFCKKNIVRVCKFIIISKKNSFNVLLGFPKKNISHLEMLF
jgi:hypothetical protein